MSAIYLRLIHLKSDINANSERAAIDDAFRESRFKLAKPLEQHPRGGFIAYVECTEQQVRELIEFLDLRNIKSCI